MSDLKSCPFCGSDRVTVWNVRDGQQALCKDCKATGAPEFNGPSTMPSARDRAVTAWNRRAEPPPSYDGSKSLGERLYEACNGAWGVGEEPWSQVSGAIRSEYEAAALNFTARLSDRGEGLGARPEPAREGRPNTLPADAWIEWKGGENPAGSQMVEWRNRCGDASSCRANKLVGWQHPHGQGPDLDIIAYRIIPATPSGTGKASG